MPKRSLETLSEPMFYVLMALRRRTLCGVEIVHWIGETTEGRITLGPGTLYTILSKLTDEQMIRDVRWKCLQATHISTLQEPKFGKLPFCKLPNDRKPDKYLRAK